MEIGLTVLARDPSPASCSDRTLAVVAREKVWGSSLQPVAGRASSATAVEFRSGRYEFGFANI